MRRNRRPKCFPRVLPPFFQMPGFVTFPPLTLFFEKKSLLGIYICHLSLRRPAHLLRSSSVAHYFFPLLFSAIYHNHQGGTEEAAAASTYSHTHREERGRPPSSSSSSLSRAHMRPPSSSPPLPPRHAGSERPVHETEDAFLSAAAAGASLGGRTEDGPKEREREREGSL